MFEKLKSALAAEEAKWEAKTYEEARREFHDDFPFSYECGKGDDYYAVEVIKLEDTEEYIHIGINVDDGSLRTTIFPKSTSVILYRDVRKKPEPK